jgi:hypothetical protein
MSSDTRKKEPDTPDPSQVSKDLVLDIFNLLFIFAIVAFFFLDIILRRQVFFAGDIMNVYSPWQIYNQEALAGGRMPLWCDDFFTGFPLFAESQGALFYPVTRLAYMFVPKYQAFSADVLLHFLLAGWFQYFFARTLGLKPWSSLLTAIAFAFSGMFLSLPINFTIFRSIVWIPLIFTFMTLGARRHSLFFPLMAAVCIVMQMMGGSLQVTAITILALIPWVFFLVLSPGKGRQADGVPILQLILTVMLAIGLYFFQLLPTLELMAHAWRGTVAGYDVASAFSFPPEHFIDVLMPTFYGIYADGTLLPVRSTANFFPYFGIAPLLLILPAFSSKKRGVFILLILVILFLALAVGRYGLVYPAVYSTVPFFDKFRAPDRFWIIAIFAGTMLAGYGLEQFVSSVEADKKGRNASSAALLSTIFLLFMLFIIGAIYTPVLKSVWRELVNMFAMIIAGPARRGVDPALYERWQIHLAWASLHLVGIITAFNLAIAMFGRKGRGGALAGAIILVTILDLYIMSFQVPALRTTGTAFFRDPPQSAEVLMRDGEPNRFYSFLKQTYAREVFAFSGGEDTIWYNGGGSNDVADYYALREVLSPDIFMHWRLVSSNGFASLFLARYFDYEGAAKQQLIPFLEGIELEEGDVSDFTDRTLMVDLMASRYMLTPIPFVPNDHFTPATDPDTYDGPINIYRNNNAFPRAWVARPETILGETPEAERRFYSAEIDPRRELMLSPVPRNSIVYPDGVEGEATARIRPVGGASGASARGGAQIDEQVIIDVSTPQPAYLILADTHYPGWVAEIDGGPVDTIYRAFGYFRAIEIPAGDHIVRFEYRPASFSTGLTITYVTMGTFILLVLIQLIFFSKQPRDKYEPRSSRR